MIDKTFLQFLDKIETSSFLFGRTQSPFTVHQQMLIHNKEIEKWVKNNNTVGSMLSSPSSWFSVKNVFAHAGIPAQREQEI